MALRLSGFGLGGFLLAATQQLAAIYQAELIPGRQLQGTFGIAAKAQVHFAHEAPIAGAITSGCHVTGGISAEAGSSDGMAGHGMRLPISTG